MQLNVNRELLLESLSSVASAVERRNPMAVLANIKFELSRDQLVLTASESLENIAKNINLPRNYVLFKPEVSVEALREIVATRITD